MVNLNSFVVVIPTLNAGDQAAALIDAIKAQMEPVPRVVVIDSGSTDRSTEAFRDAQFEIHTIAKGAFDHGGTRNLGVALAAPTEIVVFITQDALPAEPDSIARIIAPFDDPGVGLVYGRQLPRLQAGHIESHARRFNYPPTSRARVMPEAASLGIKAVFNSNSFAAYRRRALDSIGGFPDRIIMGEDQVAAGRMLLDGWKVVYQADAVVRHSHGYSVMQEFRRYFDIGVFHDDQRDLLSHFGRAESEGRRYIRSEIGHLLTRSPHRIPESLLRNAMKLAGYKIGRAHRRLPATLKHWLAMNPKYFVEAG
jgi:rhamnosyltransferase